MYYPCFEGNISGFQCIYDFVRTSRSANLKQYVLKKQKHHKMRFL